MTRHNKNNNNNNNNNNKRSFSSFMRISSTRLIITIVIHILTIVHILSYNSVSSSAGGHGNFNRDNLNNILNNVHQLQNNVGAAPNNMNIHQLNIKNQDQKSGLNSIIHEGATIYDKEGLPPNVKELINKHLKEIQENGHPKAPGFFDHEFDKAYLNSYQRIISCHHLNPYDMLDDSFQTCVLEVTQQKKNYLPARAPVGIITYTGDLNNHDKLLSVAIKQAYAEHKGYKLFFLHPNADFSDESTAVKNTLKYGPYQEEFVPYNHLWYKLPALRAAYTTLPKHVEWFLWLDHETIILDFNMDIEETLKQLSPEVEIVAVSDPVYQRGIHSGFFLMKRTLFVVGILQHWHAEQNSNSNSVQEGFSRIIDSYRLKGDKRFKMIPCENIFGRTPNNLYFTPTQPAISLEQETNAMQRVILKHIWNFIVKHYAQNEKMLKKPEAGMDLSVEKLNEATFRIYPPILEELEQVLTRLSSLKHMTMEEQVELKQKSSEYTRYVAKVSFGLMNQGKYLDSMQSIELHEKTTKVLKEAWQNVSEKYRKSVMPLFFSLIINMEHCTDIYMKAYTQGFTTDDKEIYDKLIGYADSGVELINDVMNRKYETLNAFYKIKIQFLTTISNNLAQIEEAWIEKERQSENYNNSIDNINNNNNDDDDDDDDDNSSDHETKSVSDVKVHNGKSLVYMKKAWDDAVTLHDHMTYVAAGKAYANLLAKFKAYDEANDIYQKFIHVDKARPDFDESDLMYIYTKYAINLVASGFPAKARKLCDKVAKISNKLPKSAAHMYRPNLIACQKHVMSVTTENDLDRVEPFDWEEFIQNVRDLAFYAVLVTALLGVYIFYQKTFNFDRTKANMIKKINKIKKDKPI